MPVTCRDPETGTVLHPRLANVTSMLPDRVRHDDITLHVPTTEPPQEEPPGQFCTPEPAAPPVAFEPPVPGVPPVPPWPLELLQPLLATTAARAAEPMKLISLIRIRPREATCPEGLDFVQAFASFFWAAPRGASGSVSGRRAAGGSDKSRP